MVRIVRQNYVICATSDWGLHIYTEFREILRMTVCQQRVKDNEMKRVGDLLKLWDLGCLLMRYLLVTFIYINRDEGENYRG